MAQHELNDGLRAALMKPGDPTRNPLGNNGGAVRRLKFRELRAMLIAVGDEPCDVEGYTHISKREYVVRILYGLAMEGHRWAIKYIDDRVYGRVPLDVNVTQQPQPELSYLTTEELAARVEQLRERVGVLPAIEAEHRAAMQAERIAEEHTKQLAEAIEAEVVATNDEPEPEAQG